MIMPAVDHAKPPPRGGGIGVELVLRSRLITRAGSDEFYGAGLIVLNALQIKRGQAKQNPEVRYRSA